MFSFLRNWMKKDSNENARSLDEIKQDIQEESTVNADKLEENQMELLASMKKEETSNQAKVGTELSLHPSWEQHLDTEKKYTLRFLQAELPEMIAGTIGVTGFSLMPSEGGITVAMFFRNGSAQPAQFKTLNLSIYLDDKPFARHQFDLSELGTVPPFSSRPWEVFFPEDSYLHDNFTFTRWKVLINTGKRVWPKYLDLDPEMEARMTDKQKDRLEELAKTLPTMRPDTIDIRGFDIGKTADGQLVVGLLFRNATREVYQPQKLKIKIFDAAGDAVASGTMDTSKIRVRPATTRPWLIVFPANIVKKPDANLRKWNMEITY